MRVQSLGREDPLEKEVATCPSLLAWRTPWTEEPGGVTVHGVAELDTTGWLNNKGPLFLLLQYLWPFPTSTPHKMILLTKRRFRVTLTDAKQTPQKFLRAVQGRVSSVLPRSGGQPGWEAGPPSPADRDRRLQLGWTLCGAGAGLTPASPQASVFSRS